jgi:hypothetical protein
MDSALQQVGDARRLVAFFPEQCHRREDDPGSGVSPALI